MTPGRSMYAASSHQKHPPAKMAVAWPLGGASAETVAASPAKAAAASAMQKPIIPVSRKGVLLRPRNPAGRGLIPRTRRGYAPDVVSLETSPRLRNFVDRVSRSSDKYDEE